MADANTFGIAGLFGWPVAHSRSPVIHNHWLARYAIAGRYVLFGVPPEKLEAAVRGVAVLGLRGCNVTTPHKQAIFPLLDRVDDLAQRSARSTPSSSSRTARFPVSTTTATASCRASATRCPRGGPIADRSPSSAPAA